MNFKTTVLLIVVLAAIGVYLFVSRNSNQPASPTANTPVATDAKLIDLEPTQVQRVAIAPADGQRIVLERSGDKWSLREPMAAPADADRVNNLIGAFAGLRSTGQISTDQKAAAGLDPPTYTVELTGPAGKSFTIAFGGRQLIGGMLDVAIAGRDKLDVVSSASIFDQLQQPASAYRQKNLVALSSPQIRQLSIIRPGASTVHLQDSGGQWKLFTTTGPTTAPALRAGTAAKADTADVQDMTIALAGLKADAFEDPSHPLDYFGLNPPAMEVWFSPTPPGSPETQPDDASVGHGATILIGRPVDVTKKDVYASIAGQVVTLPESFEAPFQKSPQDLRDKELLDIDPGTVTSVAIHVDRTPEAKVLGPNVPPRFDMTLERNERGEVVAPPPPATSPTTGPASQPAPQVSHWFIRSGMRVARGDDAPIEALLKVFHPLTVQKYIDAVPTTQPASIYRLTIITNTGRTETITLTDPGNGKPVVGSYGDATFELDRAVLAKITARM